MNDKRANKRGSTDAPRGFRTLPIVTGKAENCAASAVPKRAPHFAGLRSNFALTDGGARSLPLDVEELSQLSAAEMLYLLAASPQRKEYEADF